VSDAGLGAAIEMMRADHAPDEARAVFAHYYRQLESGESGLIAEADIDPLTDLDRLDELDIPADVATQAFAATAVIKLNGGLATSMGLDRAKSLLPVKDGLSFLDIMARQVLAARRHYDVRLPLILMNSFRTRDDTLAVLEKYPELPVDGVPLDFLQNREPKLLTDTLEPARWPADPSLQWCPPGHADLYPALRSTGILQTLLEQGFRYGFISNADNLGAVADPRIAGWLALNDLPFVMESVRRTAADRKGGHLAVRRADGRLVLRETAQTAPADLDALQDLDRHQYCNTNNLWLDLRALKELLDETGGVLDLPLIRNVKTIDPQDPSSPKVIQIESAMGAAVQVFEGSRSLLVERDRFVPVKTTNDLLVLRSDQYELGGEAQLVASPKRSAPEDTFVDLDPAYYRQLRDFEARFPLGPPSLLDCTSLVVHGDVTFGSGVVAHASVVLDADAVGGHIADGTELR
jgi:UTP--glucose-1-phosphate uridylyltransferase